MKSFEVSEKCINFLTKIDCKAPEDKKLENVVHLVNLETLGLNINQSQFDSLVSFGYSCGISALKYSSLVKDIKHGADRETIKDDFLKWIYKDGKTDKELYLRRIYEYEIYANGIYN